MFRSHNSITFVAVDGGDVVKLFLSFGTFVVEIVEVIIELVVVEAYAAVEVSSVVVKLGIDLDALKKSVGPILKPSSSKKKSPLLLKCLLPCSSSNS